MDIRNFIVFKVDNGNEAAYIFIVTKNPGEQEARKVIHYIKDIGLTFGDYRTNLAKWHVYGERRAFTRIFSDLQDVVNRRSARIKKFITYKVYQRECVMYKGIGLSVRDEKKFLELFKGGN